MGRVSLAQMAKLLDLLSQDGVLQDGKVMYRGTNKKMLWRRLALQLNSVNGGVYKNSLQWCKMWADWKTNTKKKANLVLRRNRNGLNQSSLRMNELELRLLKLVNHPFENGTNEQDLDNMVVDKTVEIDNTGILHVLDFNSGQFIPEDEKTSSNDEVESKYHDINESNFCNVDDGVHDTYDIGESSSGTDRNEKVKLQGKLHKRKKISLEAYKLKTTIALEQEKVQQRTEELRLKALELKIKGDELKLKEMEMNKINYLTNIEEEKLKCMRDISTSLKELLDRNKSGNFRFSNIL